VIGVRWANEPEEGRGLEGGRDVCCGGGTDETGPGVFGRVRDGWLRLVAVAGEGIGKGLQTWLSVFAVGTGGIQTGPVSNKPILGRLNLIPSGVGTPLARPNLTASEIDITGPTRIGGWTPIFP
jgi:hypothetical protein